MIVKGSLAVERDILSHLGGPRFILMTGANSLEGGDNCLSFKLGPNPKNVTHVRITLDPSASYKVEFMKARGAKLSHLYTAEMVDADKLPEVLAQHTGLVLQ
jgi:hypothetical protein